MGGTYSFKKLEQHKFSSYGFDKATEEMLGDTCIGFTMSVWGRSGNGKSTYVGVLIKNLVRFGKVYYNSTEEGFSKSVQKMAIRAGLTNIDPDKLVLGDMDTYEEMIDKLKKNRASFVVIDSIQATRTKDGKLITIDHFLELKRKFKKKTFIFISWEEGVNPKGENAKAIRYLCDIKVRVYQGIAYIDSRFGFVDPFKVPYVYLKFHDPEELKRQLSRKQETEISGSPEPIEEEEPEEFTEEELEEFEEEAAKQTKLESKAEIPSTFVSSLLDPDQN